MLRAYSTFEVKSFDDAGIIEGIASTPSTDRMGDIVDPKGAQFKLPIPLLWQHDSKQPIGHVIAAKVTDAGISIKAQIARGVLPFIDEAWALIKSGLVRGLSIGFNDIETADIQGSRWGRHFLKWEWLELSAVTIPANQDASIQTIKAAATGRDPPGVSGTQKQTRSGGFFNSRTKGNTMKTLSELREERTQKAARLNELKELWTSEDRRSTDDEASEFDSLTDEVKALDDDIRRMRFDQINSSNAKAVDGTNQHAGTSSRGHVFVKAQDQDEKFKGQNFTRMIIARAMSRQLDVSPVAIAEERWGKTNPTLVRLIKAAVAGAGSGSGEWGAELVTADTRYTGDFQEFLYSLTVFDRLPLRSVPANVMIKGQDGQGTGYWVGESKAIPATSFDFMNVSLTPLKVGALTSVPNEWMADSDPSGEMLVRDALAQASAQRIDTTFLSATAASAGVSPAGLLNGVTALTSAGDDADSVRQDIRSLYAPFIAAKNSSGLTFVTTPSLAKSLSLMVNALGNIEFPGLTSNGGTLMGDPMITGDNVGFNDIILLKPSDIYRIGDTGVQVSMSREATIEQDSAPQGASDTPVAASATLMSMFQTESTAFKVVRRINFAKRRTSAVAWIGDANYGALAT